MPTASDQSRNTMQRWFGDPVSDSGPTAFLESHGYVLTPAWQWVPPTPYHSVSCYELACILFLIHEWDFGALCGDLGKTVCLCGEGMKND